MERTPLAETDLEDEYPTTTFTIQTLIQTEAEFVGVDRAIEALQNGTYGSCEVCDTSIPSERLRNDPVLVRCDAHVVRDTPALFVDAAEASVTVAGPTGELQARGTIA